MPLPTASTVAQQQTLNVTGVATTPLYTSTTTGVTYPVVFTFTSQGSNPIQTTSLLIAVSGAGAGTLGGITYTPANCNTATLTHGQTCVASTTYTPAAGASTVTATYSYTGGSTAVPTSTTAGSG